MSLTCSRGANYTCGLGHGSFYLGLDGNHKKYNGVTSSGRNLLFEWVGVIYENTDVLQYEGYSESCTSAVIKQTGSKPCIQLGPVCGAQCARFLLCRAPQQKGG